MTDRPAGQDVLHRLTPGPLPPPAWTWPDRPGVAGCVARPGVVAIAQAGGAALFVLRPTEDGAFTGDPETMLADTYGRLAAAAPASGRAAVARHGRTRPGGEPVPSDDRVIRIQPPSGGGESRT